MEILNSIEVYLTGCRELSLNLSGKFDFVLSKDQVNRIIKDYNDRISIGAYQDQKALEQANPNFSRIAASIVKPFIFLYVLKNRGEFKNLIPMEEIQLTDDTILRYFKGSTLSLQGMLALMTDISDNSVANYFLDKIGMNEMNQFLKEEGYPDTSFGRRFLDADARKSGRENRTTVSDLHRLFYDSICGNSLTLEDHSLFTGIMKTQFDRSKFALYLPESIESGGKSGVLDNVWNDLIFFRHKERTVFLIGLTEDLPGSVARDFLSSYAYHFVNDRYPDLLQQSP